jgi:hypothetical protein
VEPVFGEKLAKRDQLMESDGSRVFRKDFRYEAQG